MADESDDDDFSSLQVEITDKTSKMTSGASGFGRAMTQAFARGIADGKQFDDVLKSLTLRLSELSLKAALRPLEKSISGGIEKLFGGLFGGISGSATREGGFGGGGTPPVSLFADGGVIARPHYFPLGPNGLGVAGEAGPEAILPLARGADGRLGVAGGGGQGTSVTINIATPDAASFRQSEVYLGGLVARAVARGQRGL